MEDSNMVLATLSSSYTCDSCDNKELPTVLFHSHGVPVVAMCRHCAPKAFVEAVAREAIEAAE